MKGYTLIEVLIALLLMAIILLGGTTLFYQNLRSSGLSDVDLNLNSSLRNVLSGIEKDIRFSQVTAVGAGTRQSCLTAGSTGYSGTTLAVTDMNGLGTTYSLMADKIASTAAVTSQISYITPDNIKIERLNFTWYCQGNVSDKINIEIDASSIVLGSGLNVTRSVSTEVNLLNSGLN